MTTEDISDCKLVDGEDKLQDYLFKLIVIGEPSVGKSCMLVRAVKGEFKHEYEVTIGAEFSSLYFDIQSKNTQLQVWDTAGMEKFRSIIKVFFNGSHAAFIVYDITRKETFDKVDSWLNMLQETTTPNIKIILVGNKKDCEADRQVSYEMGTECAARNGFLHFMETSAKTGEGIIPAFQIMAKTLYMEHKDDNDEKAITKGSNSDKTRITAGTHKKKNGCC
eukprot:TRINITY_DN2801_c0_g1_i12.p2 TRINITY_DN2801_c0_g1~~TRINITY_DN2801_c0_g1_i12.p2  ORF type:complete len:221 (+),score=76.21 TRINITY_DN2801_c0_g1_i12:53-715(+)